MFIGTTIESDTTIDSTIGSSLCVHRFGLAERDTVFPVSPCCGEEVGGVGIGWCFVGTDDYFIVSAFLGDLLMLASEGDLSFGLRNAISQWRMRISGCWTIRAEKFPIFLELSQ